LPDSLHEKHKERRKPLEKSPRKEIWYQEALESKNYSSFGFRSGSHDVLAGTSLAWVLLGSSSALRPRSTVGGCRG